MATKLMICIIAIMLCCSIAYGVTLSFDEVASGTAFNGSSLEGLSYAYNNRVWFIGNYWATDHTGSTWGPPSSGSNVLTMEGNPYYNPGIAFGIITTGRDTVLDHIQSVGAYFSTDMGKMVRITAYHSVLGVNPDVPVTSVVIGALGESWNNRYVEISTSPQSPFEKIKFEGVNSLDDLSGFCLDDLTITPVPEPSSLLALAGGLSGLGGMMLRRRRYSK